MDRTERNLTIISIIISIISLWYAFHANSIAEKANKIAEDSNKIANESNLLSKKSNEISWKANDLVKEQNNTLDKTMKKGDIDVIGKISSDLWWLKVMQEYDKFPSERKVAKEDLIPLMLTLQQLYMYYKDWFITKEQIKNNFWKFIEYWCHYSDKLITNFSSNYPTVDEFCRESNYF